MKIRHPMGLRHLVPSNNLVKCTWLYTQHRRGLCNTDGYNSYISICTTTAVDKAQVPLANFNTCQNESRESRLKLNQRTLTFEVKWRNLMGSQIIHVWTIDNTYVLYSCRTLLPWVRCRYSGTHEISLFKILDGMCSHIFIRAFHALVIRHTKIRTEITVTYLFWTEIKCSSLYKSNPYEATVCVAEAHGTPRQPRVCLKRQFTCEAFAWIPLSNKCKW